MITNLVSYAITEELIVVTNNARDFRRLMENAKLHPGLVIIVPNVRLETQLEKFEQVLDWIKQQGLADLVNKVVGSISLA